jgi:hypothetical protein
MFHMKPKKRSSYLIITHGELEGTASFIANVRRFSTNVKSHCLNTGAFGMIK